MQSVIERMFEHAEREPDKLAVVFGEEEMTYGQLRGATILLASWMKLHGVQKGDRVIVQAYYSCWFAAACYAAHLCGAAFVPVEKKASDDTLKSVAEWMEAKLAVAVRDVPGVLTLRFGAITETLAGVQLQPWDYPDEAAIADIMLTSGTTGPQKGAMLTHKNIAVNALAWIRDQEIKKNNVGITLLPLNHVGFTRELYAAHSNGSAYIFLDGVIKLRTMFDYFQKYSVSSFNLSPSAIAYIEQTAGDKLKMLSNQIDFVYIHAAPMREQTRNFLRHSLPTSRLYFSYGSSENGTVALLRFDRDNKDIRCVGTVCEGVRVNILNADLQVVEAEKEGRIAIQSEMNFAGYWKRPELMENAYHDGFFLTNDAGRFDKQGYLFVLGRIDDVINIGGLKVYPGEIENAANAITGVEECVCFDVPNDLTGSAPKLLIKTNEGCLLSTREIYKALTDTLDSYKVPKEIEFVDEIAKNFLGKPDRKYYRDSKGDGQ